MRDWLATAAPAADQDAEHGPPQSWVMHASRDLVLDGKPAREILLPVACV